MLATERGDSKEHRFPHEKPTRSDFMLWNDALRALTNSTLRLESTLGNFVREPHVRHDWALDCETSRIYQHREQHWETMHGVFEKIETRPATRHGSTYRWLMTRLGKPPGTCYALVKHLDDANVALHSWAEKPTPPQQTQGFLANLRSFPN